MAQGDPALVRNLDQFARTWLEDFRSAAGAVAEDARPLQELRPGTDPRMEWSAEAEVSRQEARLSGLQSSYQSYLSLVPGGDKALSDMIERERDSLHEARERSADLKKLEYAKDPARIGTELGGLKADVALSTALLTTATSILQGKINRVQEKNASDWQDALDVARLRSVGRNQELIHNAWETECSRLANSKVGNVADLRSHLNDVGDALDQLAGTVPSAPDVAPERDWDLAAVAALQASAQTQWRVSVSNALKSASSGGGFDSRWRIAPPG